MNGKIVLLSLLAAVGIMSGCSKCDEVQESAYPIARFRLLGPGNQDLWFGTNAPYSPDSLQIFINTAEGPKQVSFLNNKNATTPHIGLALEPRDTKDEYYFRLNGTDTDTIAYFVLVEQVNCKEAYEIGSIEQNGTLVCNFCGVPASQGGPGEYVLLRK